MLNISGYFCNGIYDIVDEHSPLRVNSAGHYYLTKLPFLETTRAHGRLDYQLLYIAEGEAHFLFNGQYQRFPKGTVIIFFPKEPQFYYYKANENAHIYWVHFTGQNVLSYLSDNGFKKSGPHFVGINMSIPAIFNKMIHELQLQRHNFMEYCTLEFQQLLLTLHRTSLEQGSRNSHKNDVIEAAIIYINANYNKNIIIKELAAQYHLTHNWFSHCFQTYTGITPQRYLSNTRISKAKELLENSSCSISEVASLTGYADPLYFSRTFKKETGLSPSQYKNKFTLSKSPY